MNKKDKEKKKSERHKYKSTIRKTIEEKLAIAFLLMIKNKDFCIKVKTSCENLNKDPYFHFWYNPINNNYYINRGKFFDGRNVPANWNPPSDFYSKKDTFLSIELILTVPDTEVEFYANQEININKKLSKRIINKFKANGFFYAPKYFLFEDVYNALISDLNYYKKIVYSLNQPEIMSCLEYRYEVDIDCHGILHVFDFMFKNENEHPEEIKHIKINILKYLNLIFYFKKEIDKVKKGNLELFENLPIIKIKDVV